MKAPLRRGLRLSRSPRRTKRRPLPVRERPSLNVRTIRPCLQVAREQQDQQDQQDKSDDPSTPVHGYLLLTELQSPLSLQHACQPGQPAYPVSAAPALLLIRQRTRPIRSSAIRGFANGRMAWHWCRPVGRADGPLPVLQIRRITLRRSSADVSLAYLAVLQVGFSVSGLRGVSANPIIAVPD